MLALAGDSLLAVLSMLTRALIIPAFWTGALKLDRLWTCMRKRRPWLLVTTPQEKVHVLVQEPVKTKEAR